MKQNKPVKVIRNGNETSVMYLSKQDEKVDRKEKKVGFFRSIWNFIKWLTKWTMILASGVAVIYTAFLIGAHKEPITLVQTVMAEEKFADYPLLVKICKAESGNIQFRKDGRVLRGGVNPADIGYCQIHEPIWNDTARKLGYDIYTEQGNKDMAIYIFLHEGSDPWKSSSCAVKKTQPCWSK